MTRLFGAVMALALALTLAPSAAVAQFTTADDCRRVVVLTSRGSGQVDAGREVTAFADEVERRLGADQVEVRRNPYPAVAVLPNLLKLLKGSPRERLRALAAAANGGGAVTKLPGLGAYHDAVVEGKQWLAGAVREIVARCGDRSEILLAGYSQGAQVAADVYQRDLSDEERAHVAGVALFGDPYFNGGDRIVARSSFSGRRDGLLGRRPAFGAPAGRVLSFCHSHDPICQGLFFRVAFSRTLDPAAVKGSSHLNYARLGEPAAAANAFVEQILSADSAGELVTPGPPSALAPGVGPVVLVVDVSGSMSEDDGTGRIKLDGAKQALLGFLRTVEPGTPLGMRTYPDQVLGDCNTGTLRVPVQPRDPTAMSATIRTLQPDGDTPTAEAMLAAVEDLRRAGYSAGTLVIVSDGEATCAPPCEAAKAIAASGIQLETITVGFRISDSGREELRCIAEATAGTYVDADDGVALAQVFDAISRPALEVTLDHPAEVTAEVGNTSQGLVRVTATIRNSGGQLARAVTARMRFDENGPGVSRPVRTLGNIGPGEEREVEWIFRASLLLVDAPVRFTVLARSDNGRVDGEASGEIRVVDRTDAASAGPILKRRGTIAILGDSYSAGEGADDYLSGTDRTDNACHRSRLTYLMPQFRLPDEAVLACSGAVTNDISNPNGSNGVAAQTRQLAVLQDARPDGVSTVVLTLGGNDAGFPQVATSCLFMLVDCSQSIYPLPIPVNGVPRAQFVRERTATLQDDLVDSYTALHGVLNAREQIARRGEVAPILVLAYPIPIPQQARALCATTFLAEARETAAILEFAVELNRIVEQAVLQARGAGVPVFFVSETEDAFLPDHTVCDRDEAYARGFESFDGAGIDWTGTLKAAVTDSLFPAWLRPVVRRSAAPASATVVWKQVRRGLAELAHPNVRGYQALSHALIRWSSSEEAADALRFLEAARPSSLDVVARWPTSSVDLGQIVPGETITLQGGTSYPVTTGGFMAGSTVEIVIRSDSRTLAQVRVDDAGVASTRIVVPEDTRPGAHTVEAIGIGADGQPRIVSVGARVDGPAPALAELVALIAGGLLLVSGVVVWLVAMVLARRAVPAASPTGPAASSHRA